MPRRKVISQPPSAGGSPWPGTNGPSNPLVGTVSDAGVGASLVPPLPGITGPAATRPSGATLGQTNSSTGHTPGGDDPLRTALRRHFGLEDFRPGQREMIAAVLAGRDGLCVMPTGRGKSLCYQLPAMMLDGVTLVVSPLIALMADQVGALRARGLPATYINSALDPAEQEARLAGVASGAYRLVFVAPERFRSGRFVEALARVSVGLLAIDEAHCISEWGHDFRPDYRRLAAERDRLARRNAGGRPPTLALTATATAQVRADIATQLAMDNPFTLVSGFDRPNLEYQVRPCADDDQKAAELECLLLEAGLAKRATAAPRGRRVITGGDGAVCDQAARPPAEGSAIIYVCTKRVIEDITAVLQRLGVGHVVYHGTLDNQARRDAQQRFMSGRAPVAVATNAFGMGVDKPDVRLVVHWHCPGTLEAYYQEAGRAGRDGLPARCAMLFAEADRMVQEFFIEGSYPSRETVVEVYDLLASAPDMVAATAQRLIGRLRSTRNTMAVDAALRLLEEAQVIDRTRPGEGEMSALGFASRSAAEEMLAGLARRSGALRAVLGELLARAGRRPDGVALFRVDELASQLDYSATTVNEALTTLRTRLACQYTPAYRGRRARVRRGLTGSTLPVDFAALERRAAAERRKVETVFAFARGEGCRRNRILAYFGEVASGLCGRCDQCRAGRGATGGLRVPPGEDPLTAARKVLACVARLAQRDLRVGRKLIVAILRGERDARVNQLGLDGLSTFGLLADWPTESLSLLVEQLVAAACLAIEMPQPHRPVLTLTEHGWAVMQQRAELNLALAGPELAAKPAGGKPKPAIVAARSRRGRGSRPSASPQTGLPITAP